jgi:hypothetical protein
MEDNGLEEETIIMFMSDDGPSPGCDISYSNRRMNESEQAERSRAWKTLYRGGRAYSQAVYEPGKWEERGSPVNMDAYVDYNTPGFNTERTSFSIDNLKDPGSYISYNINVTEKGSYSVEIGYNVESVNPGSEFIVHTKYDTASLRITGKNSSFSEILSLPEGRQLLTLKRVRQGTKNIEPERINKMIIHRIPEIQDYGNQKSGNYNHTGGK